MHGAAEFMFRASVDGQMLEGKPLSWNAEQMLLLGRDGQLYEFNPKLAKEAVKTEPAASWLFAGRNEDRACSRSSASASKFRRRGTIWSSIRAASATNGPIGSRICTTGSSITFAFAVSQLEEPPYPLVAVVFRDQAEYLRQRRRQRHADASRTRWATTIR